ncbi:MAG: hypothetical protein M1837_001651 [Sclerophora amabilis]|nr:MAG: hypothetical protein M1837_001651 [Sclerophora amabilis]
MGSRQGQTSQQQRSYPYPQFDPSQRQPPPGFSAPFLENPQLQVSHMSDARFADHSGKLGTPQHRGQQRPLAGSDENASDGSSGHQQRHSILQTPIEMHRPTFPQSRRTPTEPTIAQSPISPVSDTMPVGPGSGSLSSPDRATSPYRIPPPTDHHPGLSAPYTYNHSAVSPQSPYSMPLKSQEKGSHMNQLPNLIVPDSLEATKTQPMNVDYNESQKSEPPKLEHWNPNDVPSRTNYIPSYAPDSAVGPDVMPPGKHQPGQIAHPTLTSESGEWRHALCECGDLPTCCVGFWCPCILYGKIQYRLNRKSARKDPTDLLGHKSFNGPCGLLAVACGFQWLLALLQHTRIRRTYKLNGSVGKECLSSFCCCCCMLMQNEREMRDREEGIRKLSGPVPGVGGASGYVPPSGMTYAPQ